MRLPLAALLLLALALALAPASAGAATFEPLSPCYQSVRQVVNDKTVYRTQRVFLVASGFTPNSRVQVAIDGKPVKEFPTDANGALPAGSMIFAPSIPKSFRTFIVRITDIANPEIKLEQKALVNALTLTQTPGKTSPRRKVRWQGRGFTLDKPIYLHYLYGSKLRHRKTVKLASPKGQCGRLDVRRAQFPFTPRTGRWVLQFDQQPKYSGNAGVFWQIEVNIRAVVRVKPA